MYRRHYTLILCFHGQRFVEQDATGCSLREHLVWTAGHKIVWCGFEAREDRNAVLLNFILAGL